MERAKVTLRQAQIDRLVKGETITIRLRTEEVDIRFDSLANVKVPSQTEKFLDELAEMGSRLRRR